MTQQGRHMGVDVDPEALNPDSEPEASTHTEGCTVCATCTPTEAERGQEMGLLIDPGDDDQKATS